MAKVLSNVNILTGEIVEAHHVSQSIDAFTGVEAYDITLSGSFTVTGSTNLDSLNIQTIGTGSSVIPLGLDANGNVVTSSIPTTPSEIVEFDTTDPNLAGTVFSPNTPQASNTLYVSTEPTTTGQTWIWNTSTLTYETYTVTIPDSTPFWLYGTSIDAGSNKTAMIQRNGPIFINSSVSNGSRYAGYFYSRRTSGQGNGMLIRRDDRQTSGYGLRVQKTDFTTSGYPSVDQLRVNHDGSLLINDAYTLPNVDGNTNEVLSTDGAGNVTWKNVDIDSKHGQILYVSSNGNDSTAQIGNINKPYATLKAAKNASVSGDVIYVFPQTITFDNSNSTGNQYNGIWQTDVNLWKDGVTYYFSAGCKINMINETSTGQDMALFYPVNAGETCTVLGHLEFVASGLGANTSNGKSMYLNSTAEGFTFHSETKLLKSTSCELISLIPLNPTTEINITIISEYEEKTLISGNSGSGAAHIILGTTGNAAINFTAIVKNRRYNTSAYGFYLRGDLTSSNLNIDGERMSSTSVVFHLRDFKCNNLNVKVKDIYYLNGFGSTQLGAVVSTHTAGGWILNMESNLYDYSDNSSTAGIFYLNHSGNILNFKGNIVTKTSSGVGRFIASASTGNIININSNIDLAGAGTTTNVIMQSFGTAIINFTGRIYGNFNYTFHPRQGGEINVTNSEIKSIASNFVLYDHTDTTVSTLRLSNTKVSGLNDLDTFGDGQYLNVLISNCDIINSGNGNTLTNLTNSGVLQILNSSIFSQLGLSIDYNTVTTVVSSNTTVNTNYSISDLKGDITILTDLIK